LTRLEKTIKRVAMTTPALVAVALSLLAPAQAAEAPTPPADAAAADDAQAEGEEGDGYVSPFANDAPEEPKKPVALPEPAPAPEYIAPPAAVDQLNYADHLFLDGDWYRSIGEYRRFLYQVRGRGQEAPRAALAVGEALLRGTQYDAAGRQLDGVAQRTSSLQLRRTALFGAARAYLLDGRPELAKPRFRLISQEEGAPLFVCEESTWLLAWGHFDAGELEVALAIFEQIAAGGGRHALDAQGIVAKLKTKESLPTKNPLLAGALSLIPGLGHLYLGQVGVASTSAAWNALFIMAAAIAFLQGNWGPAIILTVFELGWYTGGIFGAMAGAYRHNRDVVRNWRDEILSDYGATRDIPDMHLFQGRNDAPPGSLVRFGGAF
jgi:TM2 domain-containing membrane protein YozV